VALRQVDIEAEPLPRGPWQSIPCFH